jgi:hypothetical protein
MDCERGRGSGSGRVDELTIVGGARCCTTRTACCLLAVILLAVTVMVVDEGVRGGGVGGARPGSVRLAVNSEP